MLVRYAPDALELEISDDGNGVALGRASATSVVEAGQGLIGMRECVALFGGELVGSAPDQGFRARARRNHAPDCLIAAVHPP